MKTFIHKFNDGTVIKLDFDLSQDMPYCSSNLVLDKQPVEILNEYRIWLDNCVVPELVECLSRHQLRAFAKFGLKNLNQTE